MTAPQLTVSQSSLPSDVSFSDHPVTEPQVRQAEVKKDGHQASKVAFWANLGPFLVLLTLLATLIKDSSSLHLVLPISALIGLPLCWKWKMSGLVGALILLTSALIYSYLQVPIDERFWQVGLAMAVALGFVVTTLCQEELSAIVDTVEVESQSRLQNMWRLDEKLKRSQEHWKQEYQAISAKLAEVARSADEKDRQLKGYERLVGAVRQDLERSQEYQAGVVQELFERRTEVAQLKQSLEVAGVEGSPKQDLTVEQQLPSNAAMELLVEEKRVLTQQLEEERQKIRSLHEEHGRIAKEIPTVLPDSSSPEQRRWEGKYRQLREQFDEKTKTLDSARQELFRVKEQCLTLQREQEEMGMVGVSEIEASLEKSLCKLEQECQQAEKERQEEVDALERIVALLTKQTLNAKCKMQK